MISILLVIQVLLALAIIGLILLQRGKGADAGAALGGGGGGGGGSSSVFGARGAANFLSRTTAVLAAAFFVNSMALASLSANMQSDSALTTGSVIEQSVEPVSDVPSAEEPVSAPVSDVPAAPATDIPATEK